MNGDDNVADMIEVELSEDQIRALFDAFDASDWASVDAVLDGIDDETYALAEAKAGGLDRNRGGAEKLRHYWTRGPGAAKIQWGTHGDWDRCVSELTKYLGPRAKGYCNLRHKEMNGFYPGDKRNKSAASPFDASLESKDYPESGSATSDGAPMLEHKNVGVTGLKVLDPKDGIVQSIISVTGIVDEVKDRIKPGAYAKTLATRKPKGVWSHDWDTPVSRTLDVKELLPGDPDLPERMPNGQPWPREAGALQVKTQFNLETQRGREAYSDVVFFGDEQEWSIGYNVPVGGATIDSKSGVRNIESLELYEYSPVLFGAMPLARTTSVKEAQLAFKALKTLLEQKDALPEDEPDDEAVVEDVESVDDDTDIEVEYEDGFDDEDDEFDDDEPETKMLSANSVELVQKAIDTLKSLLEAIVGEDEDREPVDDESVEKKAAATDTEEGYDTLAEACDSLDGLDPDVQSQLVELAGAVDDAYDGDDPDVLGEASKAYLDFIETSLKGADDDASIALKDAADLVVQMMDTSDMPEPDAEETPAEDSAEGDVEEPVVEGKRMVSTDERTDLADEGMAMPDGSFPIANESDLKNAIKAYGRAKDKEAAKAHITRCAKKMGKEDLLPEGWGNKVLIDTSELDELRALLD